MTDTPIKTCRRCEQSFPATLEFFYKNAGGKFGVTPRCKPCVNLDNAESHAKRLTIDPERIRAMASERSKRSYQKNLDQSRERQREHQRKNRQHPERYAQIQARKRGGGAGLSPEEIEAIRTRQGNKCAICEDPEPTDLDHCHETGVVRFLLCKHCNRGLGAFRDKPALLRKAAQLLEQFYDHQSD